MKRRRFVPLAAIAPWLISHPARGALNVQYRRPPAFFAYRERIPAGSDEFGALKMPLDPPRTSPPQQTLFADVTGSVLSSEQLSRGVPFWMAALDPATGIDIYGNNGIAVGDIDGDGIDEIYVSQPGGLPNRLLKWQDKRLEDISSACGLDLLDETACALFLDLRNIGRQDLIVALGSGPVLFLNDGSGRFRLSPGAFRFASPRKAASRAWLRLTTTATAAWTCTAAATASFKVKRSSAIPRLTSTRRMARRTSCSETACRRTAADSSKMLLRLPA